MNLCFTGFEFHSQRISQRPYLVTSSERVRKECSGESSKRHRVDYKTSSTPLLLRPAPAYPTPAGSSVMTEAAVSPAARQQFRRADEENREAKRYSALSLDTTERSTGDWNKER
ncbi:hypothetical protein O3P69_008338 [Scylla paramamosain]|uniref:Uncharacterized protein n=1 Tax=Scylla paramamosain TaxID=85552 RepID=A0AAW0SK85_SCYPA